MKAILVAVIVSMLIGVSLIGEVMANPSSYQYLPKVQITNDGKVIPQDSPIEQVGNTYTLTDDIISKTLEIQKDNIVIDGAGHKLQDNNKDWYIFGTGISILQHSSIIIKNITILGYNNGMNIVQSNNIVVTNNTFINSGVFLTYCKDCNILDNTFSQNKIAILLAASNNINITKNTLIDNGEGIRLETSPGIVSFVNILENSISNNAVNALSALSGPGGGDGTAISMIGSSNVLVANNNIKNANCGIRLLSCKNNISIYRNSFISNGVSFSQKLSQPCLLDNGAKGNFWSEYNSTDNNNDGIGDTPYKLDVNNTDYYPLVKPSDIAPSTSTIPTVAPNAVVSNPNLPIIVTIAIVIVIVLVILAILIMRRKRQTNS